MQFGGTATYKDKAASVSKRLGATTGASKGKTSKPKTKVKPVLKKNKVGLAVKVTY